MARKLTERKVIEALDWTYDKAINGVLGLDSAEGLTASYSDSGHSPTKRDNELNRRQSVKAGTSGFLAGLGGWGRVLGDRLRVWLRAKLRKCNPNR